MLRRLAFLLSILFIGVSLRADFKIIGGMNLSWFQEENIDWTPKFGLAGGIGIEFDLTYRTLLEIDLLYFQRGGLRESPGLSEKHILSAGSIPVLLRGKLFFGSSPYLAGGGEISSVLSYKAKQNGGEAAEIEGLVSMFDYGLVGAAGYEFEIQEDLFIFLELRGHYGLRNLLLDSSGGQERKTLAVVFMIGVRS